MCEANTLQDANNKGADRTTLMHRLGCTFGVRKYERQVLSYHGRVIYYFQITISKLLVEENYVFGLGRAMFNNLIQSLISQNLTSYLKQMKCGYVTRITKELIRLRGSMGWSALLLFAFMDVRLLCVTV